MTLIEWFDERAELMRTVEYYERWITETEKLLADGYRYKEHYVRALMEEVKAELKIVQQELVQHANYPGRDVIIIPWMRLAKMK